MPAVGRRNSDEPGRVPTSCLHLGGEDRMASFVWCGKYWVKRKKSVLRQPEVG